MMRGPGRAPALSQLKLGGAEGLRRTQRDHRRRLHPIDKPWRRPGRWGTVLGGKRVTGYPAAHPERTKACATLANSPASTTRSAAPSTTRSNGSVATLTAHRRSRAKLRDLRVAGPEVKYQLPLCRTTPSGVTWGLPSGLIVVSHVVWRCGPPLPGAWVSWLSSTALTRSHSIGGVPYPSRLRGVIVISVLTGAGPEIHRPHSRN